MTKKEQEVLYELLGEVKSFMKNTDERHELSQAQFNEHRKKLEEDINKIHEKIDQGQADDKITFEKITDEIYNDTNGIRVRVKSLEGSRDHVKKAAVWLGSSGTLGGLMLTFKEKLSILAEQIFK